MTKKNEKNIKNVKKQTKTVKEKEIIKKSDFEGEGSNKKILIVALVLALLIGGFAYVRWLNNKPVEEPQEEEKENKEDKEDNEEVELPPVVEEQVQNNYVPAPQPVAPVVPEVVDIWKDLNNIPTTIEAGTVVTLPEVKVEEDGKEVAALITFKYRKVETDDYTVVNELDTAKLGEYIITYTLNLKDSKVETKDVIVKIVDTTEPVINNVKNDGYYSEDILLDITEYSPYIVTLNGVAYNKDEPITVDGEYTLVVTEDTELQSSVTVKFVIDKTDPVISGVSDKSYYNTENNGIVIDVTDDNIEEENIILTKDDEVITFAKGVTSLKEEGSYKITAKDKAGNEVVYTFVIDNTLPIINVEYTPDNENLTSEKVKVVITSDEILQEITGWTISEEKLTLSKEFEENTELELDVKDLAGNTVKTKIVIDYIDYKVEYKPNLTIENLITNQVKATITSLKKLTISEDWKETVLDDGTYTYEKLYDANKKELVDYSYEDEQLGVVNGQIEVNIEGFDIEAFVTYDQDTTTQDVTVYVVTKEEVATLPDGWLKDDNYMASDYRYYKVYTENVEYELVQFVTENNTYAATIVIDIIDRDEPEAEADVTYIYDNDEKDKVVIVVSANEEIVPVAGWSQAEDKKSILKIVDKPATVPTDDVNESVTIVDLKGNELEVNYTYNWN